MKPITSFLIAITGLLIPSTQFAQNIDNKMLDSLFTILDNNKSFMGSIAIHNNGIEVYSNSVGYSNYEEKMKAHNKTMYKIGSITKTYTATLIMKAIDEKKLQLSTTLSKFFPEIQNSDSITIEHLLRHRSGIFNFTDAQDYTTYNTKPTSRLELLQKIIKLGSTSKPGTQFEYSNSNFVLLTFILEDVYKMKYADILSKNIIQPLALKNTAIVDVTVNPTNQALSYQKFTPWKVTEQTNPTITLGAGNISATAADVNLFLHALFSGKLCSENSLNAMKTLNKDFGLGLIQVPFYDRKALGHTGGIDGYLSNAFYFTDDNTSITILTNGLSTSLNDVIVDALSIYYGKEYTLPAIEQASSLDQNQLNKYIGVYSTPSIPIKLTFIAQEGMLVAQGTNQPQFVLTYKNDDTFHFEAAGVVIVFLPEKNQMILKQGGGEFTFTKE